MKLIVGLGNPGKEYARTRHNIGFRVLDALARELNLEFEKKGEAEIARGKDIILVKPLKFMNDSGAVIERVRNYYKALVTEVFIIHDEIDLPLGKLKLYGKGGSAGHKGIDSIIKALGFGFTRLRIGIENRKEYRIPPTDDYVLQNFTGDEEKILETKTIPAAILEIEKFLTNETPR